MEEIEFFFGLGSRYSYLAFTQISRIEASLSCGFRLSPLSSVELMGLRGPSPFRDAPLSGQYQWDYRRRDAEAWASYYRVPFVEPKPLPEDHRLMARACCAAELQGAIRGYCEVMFEAVFATNESIDAEACVAIASRMDLDAGLFREAMDSSAVEQSVSANARRAFERGAFGVPTFVIDDRMFWGNDAKGELDAVLTQGVGECLPERPGLTGEYVRRALDENHFAPKATNGLRHLDADRPASEHEQPAGDGLHGGHLTVRPNAFEVVQTRHRRDDGLRTRRYDHVSGCVANAVDVDHARPSQPGATAKQVDAPS